MVYKANFALMSGSPRWSVAPGVQVYVFGEGVCPEATGIYAEIYRVGRFGLEPVWKMERSSPPRLRIAREEVLAV